MASAKQLKAPFLLFFLRKHSHLTLILVKVTLLRPWTTFTLSLLKALPRVNLGEGRSKTGTDLHVIVLARVV